MMHREPRVGVGAVVISKQGKVLLALRRRAPEAQHWGILGGKVEYFETLEDAVRREVKEESGLDVTIQELLCVTDHIITEENSHWVSPAYLCEINSGSVEKREPNTIAEIDWFAVDDLPSPLTMTARNALEVYRSRHRRSNVR